MITPNIEERLITTLNKLNEWRTAKQEFLPVVYTDNVQDKQVLPTENTDWQTFDTPYTLYEKEKYYWFKAQFSIKRENANQKAYVSIDTHIARYLDAGTIKPQGLIYLNGKLVQGIDINHKEVLVDMLAIGRAFPTSGATSGPEITV